MLSSVSRPSFCLKAIVDKPSIASFAALRDPTFEPSNSLTQVLQPVAVLSTSGGKHAALARRVSLELQQGKLIETPAKGKARDAASGAALATFLRESNQQGSDPGVVGKKMPLLSRLAGGIKAWGRSEKAREKGADKAQGVKAKALPQYQQGELAAKPPVDAGVGIMGGPTVDMEAVAKKLADAVELS